MKRMLRAVVYPVPFVAGRDDVIADRTIDIFNRRDQEWLANQITDETQYVTLTCVPR